MLNHISSLGTSCTVRSLVGVRPCMPHSEAKKKKKKEKTLKKQTKKPLPSTRTREKNTERGHAGFCRHTVNICRTNAGGVRPLREGQQGHVVPGTAADADGMEQKDY